MLNDVRVTVAGNVTRPPEVKHSRNSGKPFTVVPIAVNDRRFDVERQQWVEEGTTYYDIACYNGMGANALASLSVGMPVIASGRFRLHEWTSDTAKGMRPRINADSIGIDLTWGTAAYSKGMSDYPRSDDYDMAPPPPSEGGPAWVDAPPGTRVDAQGEVHDLPTGPGGPAELEEPEEDYSAAG